MAKKPAKGKANVKAPSSGGVSKTLVVSLLVAVVPFSLPSAIIIGVSMLPTLGAYVNERGPDKYAFLCVGGLNFAAVIPYLFSLWFGVDTIEEATRMLTESALLFWAYAAAMTGWFMYRAMPPLVSGWLRMNSNRRIASLKSAQKRLSEDWGDDVVKTADSGGRRRSER